VSPEFCDGLRASSDQGLNSSRLRSIVLRGGKKQDLTPQTRWKKRLADYYREKGYRVVEEYPIGQGKTVDLVAMKEGKRLVIEIETGKSDAVYNIRKDLEAGFDTVLSVGYSPELINKIVQNLKATGFDSWKKLRIVSFHQKQYLE